MTTVNHESVVDIDRPYRMISGQGEQAERVYHRSPDGQWFWDANSDEPAAHIYFDPRDPKSEGFDGATLTFKCVDGTVVAVKGPWHANSDSMFVATGIDLRNLHKTWGVVALQRIYRDIPRGWSGNSTCLTMRGVLHKDDEPVIGAFQRIQQIAQRFADELDTEVYYYSESHGGSSCGPVYPIGKSPRELRQKDGR